jgi:hypothetical protein
MSTLKSVFAYVAISAAAVGAAAGIVALDQQEHPRAFTCTTPAGDVYKGEMVEKGAIISGGQLHMRKQADGYTVVENHMRSKVIPLKNATCTFDR